MTMYRRISGKPSLVGMSSLGGLLLLACGSSKDSNEIASPATTSSTSNTGVQALSYAEAFPQDRVRPLTITITSENWQKMLADMADMLGDFGANSGAIGGPFAGLGAGGAGALGPTGPMLGVNGTEMRQPGANGGAGMLPLGANAGAGMLPPGANAAAGMPPGAMGGGQTPGGMGEGSVDMIPRTPVYVECSIRSEGAVLQHVGIRFKGNSSLATAWQSGVWKLPLRLKFDEFESDYPETAGQRYYGFQDLSLSNGQSDPSLLRDKIGAEVFFRAGLPSSASAFYRVTIDHGEGPLYFGLYTGLEIPKEDAFLTKFFGNKKGNLYKPDGVGARFQTYDETTLSKENNETAADFSDVHGLYDALHGDRSDAAVWRSALESLFNVDGFLRWLATNTVIQDWDSYGQMPHNYYLYADAKDAGRLAFIPWDHSYAFSADHTPLSLGLSEVTEAWPLIRYLIDDPVYSATYRRYVASTVVDTYESVWAKERFLSAHELIAPEVVGANGEQSGYSFIQSAEAFGSSLEELNLHVDQRSLDVANFLAQ